MTKVTIRHHIRPLSFVFKRQAERQELELLVKSIKAELPNDKAATKALLRAACLAVLSFIFVAPLTIFFAYLAQKITSTPLLDISHIFLFGGFWISLFMINVCTTLIVERKYALKHLKNMNADLNNQMVLEETWRFVAAKSLTLPNTNKKFHLLLADTGDIIALPHSLYAQPPADLTLLRAPLSLLYIKSFSSGPILETQASYVFAGKEADNPLNGENLRLTRSLSWDKIESFARPS